MLFHSHPWIQIWVVIPKFSNRSQIVDSFAFLTTKSEKWHWKIIGHLFCAISSFVHVFKLELVWKHLIQVKMINFFSLCNREIWGMTLKNNRAPLYATSSSVHYFVAICKFKLELQCGIAKFWSKLLSFLAAITLKFNGWVWKNNTAPHLCHFKFSASCQSHLWI